MPLLFTTTSNFQQGEGKDVLNCFEEFLKPWFVSINDLLTFPIYITEFYTSMFWSNDYVWILFQSILIIEQGSLKGSRDLSRNKNMYGDPKEHDYLNFYLLEI